jgi:hypothetical protein
MPAVPERPHDAERGQDLHEWLGDLVGPMVLEGQVEQSAVDAVEALGLVGLAPEGLDDLHARERLVQQHAQLGDLLLRALVDTVEPPADAPHRQAHEREDQDRDDRQPPLPHRHHPQQRDHHRQLAEGHDEDRGGHAGQPVDVGDDARHQLGRVQVGEERQRHRLDVRVEIAPQPGHHALADRRHQVGLAVASRPLEEIGAEQQERDDAQHGRVVADEDLVHRRLHEPGDRAFHGRHDEGQRGADHQRRHVGAHQRQQPPVHDHRVSHAGTSAASSRR